MMGTTGLDLPGAASALQNWGGWSLFFLACIWWIRTAPERRRADTEHDSSAAALQATHIKALQEENSGLRSRLETVEAGRADDRRRCQEENDELRAEWRSESDALRARVHEMEDIVRGLQRQIAQNSNSSAHMLGDIAAGARGPA